MAENEVEPYPSDVTDEEWSFVLPVCRCAAGTVRNGSMIAHGIQCGSLCGLDQQMQRCLAAGCFGSLVEDVRSLLREWDRAQGASRPQFASIAARCSRRLRAGRRLVTTEPSGARFQGSHRGRYTGPSARADGDVGRSGDREQVQEVTGGAVVELAYVDQGYTGPNATEAAQQHGLRLEVVKHPIARRGFVCCHAAGLLSDPPPGPHVSAAWQTTTSGSTPPSRDFICSPSPPSCCETREDSQLKFLTRSRRIAHSCIGGASHSSSRRDLLVFVVACSSHYG